MNFRVRMTGLALLSAAMMIAGPALSMTSNQPPPAKPALLSEHGARQIAWHFGITHVEEIARSGGRWEIAGRDRDGNEAMLDISAYDGRILD
ncbi:hypothetical protein J2Y55_004395 [Bosea sp. BE125]|uniref:hypothetical protein n=1 Tax=Bosea sp. BE125 TaxID=2817909 RepID=UPI00286059B5|nr:hypothetical protein [Bosea sp. BE125]MDR6873371.1 hypothetical protein [Bosea sp. BE125]